jgi:hypothetical protein
VSQKQVTKTPARYWIFGRKLHDFAERAAPFGDQRRLFSGGGALGQSQIQLTHGGAQACVGVGALAQLARQVARRGLSARVFVGVEQLEREAQVVRKLR